MGYEIQLQKQILALLELFRECAPDQESHALVTALVANKSRWIEAHDLFDVVRDRLLKATGDAGRPFVPKDRIDHARVSQYYFEELCLKSIYNESDTDCPFDSDSPFFVAGSAIQFARNVGVPIDSVLKVIAPNRV